MTIKLLDGLSELGILVGADFPDADEDALWRCAQAWTAAAAELRLLSPDAVTAGERVVDCLGGESGLAFSGLWRSFAGGDQRGTVAGGDQRGTVAGGDQRGTVAGDRGLVEQSAILCEQLAAACDNAAVEVEYAKLQYIAALIILAAAIAWCLSLIWAGGVSGAGIPLAIAAAQITIRLAFMRLLTAIAAGVAFNVLLDAAVQKVQIELDHRDRWDFAKTRRAAEDGAIFGAIGGGVFLGAGRLAPGVMSTPTGLLGAAGLAGAAGGVTAPLAHGEIPTGRDFLMAVTSGLVGGIGPDLAHGRIPTPDLTRLTALDPGALDIGSLSDVFTRSTDDPHLGLAGPAHQVAGDPAQPSNDGGSSVNHGPDGGARSPQADGPARQAVADSGQLAGRAVADADVPTPRVGATDPMPPRPDLQGSHPTSVDRATPGAARVEALITPTQVPSPTHAIAPTLTPNLVPTIAPNLAPSPVPGAATAAAQTASTPSGTVGGVDQRGAVGGVDQRGAVGGVDQRGTVGGVDQRGTVGGVDQRGTVGPPAGLVAGSWAGLPPGSGPSALWLADAGAVTLHDGDLPPEARSRVAQPPDVLADAAAAADGGDGSQPDAMPGWELTDTEAIDLVRHHVFDTDAGLAFYAVDDEIRDFARAVHPADGYVTLDLHGSPRGFQIDDYLISPEQFAGALRELRVAGVLALPAGAGIKLLSCDTAFGGDHSPAATLARELGVEVVAPDQPVWTTLDGDEIVASPILVDGNIVPADPPDGSWHRFDPAGSELPPTADQVQRPERRIPADPAERGGTDAEPRARDVGFAGGDQRGDFAGGDQRGDFQSPTGLDPLALVGRDPDEIMASIPTDWLRTPSRSGGGVVFADPDNLGRQIRIMPGYTEGNRPDPLTHGPYAEISQQGVRVKIPLLGNPMLEGE